MERQSNLHSPRVDDELEHEVASLTHGAPVESRVEESRVMEDAGDDEPVAQAIVSELQDAEGGDEVAGGLSRGEVIARSELAIHLRPSIFPAGRDAILECAEAEDAPTTPARPAQPPRPPAPPHPPQLRSPRQPRSAQHPSSPVRPPSASRSASTDPTGWPRFRSGSRRGPRTWR